MVIGVPGSIAAVAAAAVLLVLITFLICLSLTSPPDSSDLKGHLPVMDDAPKTNTKTDAGALS